MKKTVILKIDNRKYSTWKGEKYIEKKNRLNDLVGPHLNDLSYILKWGRKVF